MAAEFPAWIVNRLKTDCAQLQNPCSAPREVALRDLLSLICVYPSRLVDALKDTDISIWRDALMGTAAPVVYEEDSNTELRYRFEILTWLASTDPSLFAQLDPGFLTAQIKTVVGQDDALDRVVTELLKAIESLGKREFADEKDKSG